MGKTSSISVTATVRSEISMQKKIIDELEIRGTLFFQSTVIVDLALRLFQQDIERTKYRDL